MTRMARLCPLSARLLTFLLLPLLLVGGRAAAQTAESVSQVKRVAFDWSGSAKGSAGVRERVEQKLKSSGKIQIVQDAAQSDAVLRGSATIWTTGFVASSPRSKGAEQATFQGYASAELNGKSGKTLWSYLVTPRKAGWKSITDDLGDQLATALVDALVEKTPGDGGAAPTAANPAVQIKLTGAGGTFPAPIYRRWFESIQQARPGLQIAYDAVGSEEAISRIEAGSVDFGASDIPLSAAQLQQNDRKLHQFATVLGAVVPIYNLQSAPGSLNFTGEVLAGIFMGKIQRWNAPEIQATNKRAHLPNAEIVVIHRSDGSGTTFAWTDFLSKVSPQWKSSVGMGMTVQWPAGSGVERNDGMAEAVRKTPNSIGYVEFLYALQHELEFGAVRNGSGEFVKADLDSVTAAAKTAVIPPDGGFGVSITNARGRHTYPIATFTWLLLPEDGTDAAKKTALRDLSRWMLTAGQKQCQEFGYSPLPPEFASRELQALSALN
jgi:phosphate transport system substrate-binding protein